MKATLHGATGDIEVDLDVRFDPGRNCISIAIFRVIPDPPMILRIVESAISIDPVEAPALISALMAARAESKRQSRAGQAPAKPVDLAAIAAIDAELQRQLPELQETVRRLEEAQRVPREVMRLEVQAEESRAGQAPEQLAAVARAVEQLDRGEGRPLDEMMADLRPIRRVGGT